MLPHVASLETPNVWPVDGNQSCVLPLSRIAFTRTLFTFHRIRTVSSWGVSLLAWGQGAQTEADSSSRDGHGVFSWWSLPRLVGEQKGMGSRGILTVWQNVSNVLGGHQDVLLETARKGSSASWFPACTCRGAHYCFSALCIAPLHSQRLSPSYDPNSTIGHAWPAGSVGTRLRVTSESFLSISKNRDDRDEFKCGHVSHEGSTQSSSESWRERGPLSLTWDNECSSPLHYFSLMSSQQAYHPKWPIWSCVFLFHICILHENISSGRAGSALCCSSPYNQCLEQRLANSKCILHTCWMTKLYILAEGLPVILSQQRRVEKERGVAVRESAPTFEHPYPTVSMQRAWDAAFRYWDVLAFKCAWLNVLPIILISIFSAFRLINNIIKLE